MGEGNPFIPFVGSLYLQLIDQTLKDIAQLKIDLSKVRADTWQGRDAWVVGSNGASDLTSPQFWVDAESKVLVRMILRPDETSPPIDVQLDRYDKAGNAVLATRTVMFVGGARVLAEEYSDWKVDTPLDAALFDAATWGSARHWVPNASGG